MKKSMIAVLVLATTVPASAKDFARDTQANLPVAYEALRDGRTQDAVAELTSNSETARRDPSRLINLGTAYARLGLTEEAAAMYRAAAASPIRYDLELASGRFMDSRWAARIALDGLTKKGRVTIALASAR